MIRIRFFGPRELNQKGFSGAQYASSWNTQMVSLVTGLEGVMLITVDLCTLGMAHEDERCHCRMTTIMTNDSVVADAFRPYRPKLCF